MPLKILPQPELKSFHTRIAEALQDGWRGAKAERDRKFIAALPIGTNATQTQKTPAQGKAQ